MKQSSCPPNLNKLLLCLFNGGTLIIMVGLFKFVMSVNVTLAELNITLKNVNGGLASVESKVDKNTNKINKIDNRLVYIEAIQQSKGE